MGSTAQPADAQHLPLLATSATTNPYDTAATESESTVPASTDIRQEHLQGENLLDRSSHELRASISDVPLGSEPTVSADSSGSDGVDLGSEPEHDLVVKTRRRWHGVTRPVPPMTGTSVAGVPGAWRRGSGTDNATDVDDTVADAVQRTAMAVRSLTISVNRFRAAIADALEISPTDVLALTEVSLRPGLTPGELADRIGVGIAGTSAVIDRLVTAGFARRVPSTTDRRTYNLALSPAGVHAVGWITDATHTAITDAHTQLADHANEIQPCDSTRSGAEATVAHVNALSAAYYRHADTLSAR